MPTVVLVANASEAFLYTSENLRTQPLKLIKTFEHPESRLKSSDLVTDKAGTYSSSFSGTSSASAYERSNPKTVEAGRFMQMLLDEVNKDKNQYSRLVLIMPAHLYGNLNKHLHWDKTKVTHLAKDYTKCKPQELLTHLREHLFT